MTAKEKFEAAIKKTGAQPREIKNQKYWVGGVSTLHVFYIYSDGEYYDHFWMSLEELRNDVRVAREVITLTDLDDDTYCVQEDERTLLREFICNEEMLLADQREAAFIMWENGSLDHLRERDIIVHHEAYEDDKVKVDHREDLALTVKQKEALNELKKAAKHCKKLGVWLALDSEACEVVAFNSQSIEDMESVCQCNDVLDDDYEEYDVYKHAKPVFELNSEIFDDYIVGVKWK